MSNPIHDLHQSVNDIYLQYDEGSIDYNEAVEILSRIAAHFLKGVLHEVS